MSGLNQIYNDIRFRFSVEIFFGIQYCNRNKFALKNVYFMLAKCINMHKTHSACGEIFILCNRLLYIFVNRKYV